MEEILHDQKSRRFLISTEGHTAYVEYDIHDGMLDILHTVVPPPVEGLGIASSLVRHVFDYALRHGLKPEATCSYARTWLARHPEY